MMVTSAGRPADFEPIATVDLVGGALCFDFTNTASARDVGPVRERLRSYADLVVWSERVGLMDGAAARRLRALAQAQPADAARMLARAVELREAIYRVFSRLAAGERVASADLETLNATLARGAALRRVAPGDAGFTWVWSPGRDPLAAPLWSVAQSAAELLTGGRLERVKECGSRDCNWLFYDGSKNRSRRWCDMRDCGNRAKARRHHARLKRARQPATVKRRA